MKKIAIYSILLLVVFAVGSFLGLYLYDKYNEYQIEKQNEQAKIEFQNKIKENEELRNSLLKSFDTDYVNVGIFTRNEYKQVKEILESEGQFCPRRTRYKHELQKSSPIKISELSKNKCISNDAELTIFIHQDYLNDFKKLINSYNNDYNTNIKLFNKLNIHNSAEMVKKDIINFMPNAVDVVINEQISDDYLNFKESKTNCALCDKSNNVKEYLKTKGFREKSVYDVPEELSGINIDKENQKLEKEIQIPKITVDIYFNEKTRITDKERSVIKALIQDYYDNFDKDFIFIKSNTK